MFGGSTMGLRRKFVLLGGFSVCLMHGISSRESVDGALSRVHEADQSSSGPGMGNNALFPVALRRKPWMPI
jgi:hypothetical protein